MCGQIMKISYVIVTIKSWNIDNAKRYTCKFSNSKIHIVHKKENFNYDFLIKKKPRYIFIIHWSWKIPKQIYENFECVLFHITDLPFGRGGSPLQNLIERGIYRTKISAIRVTQEMDAGPVYLKRNLTLNGSAEQIFRKASKIIFNRMIPYIIKNQPRPIPQKGRVVLFKRRFPTQSDISRLNSLEKVYDYIRMLDAEGYPKAFIKTKNLKFEFFNAKLDKNKVITNAHVSLRKEK